MAGPTCLVLPDSQRPGLDARTGVSLGCDCPDFLLRVGWTGIVGLVKLHVNVQEEPLLHFSQTGGALH